MIRWLIELIRGKNYDSPFLFDVGREELYKDIGKGNWQPLVHKEDGVWVQPVKPRFDSRYISPGIMMRKGELTKISEEEATMILFSAVNVTSCKPVMPPFDLVSH